MKSRNFCWLLMAYFLFAAGSSTIFAAAISIGRTPILAATLPTNSTSQVEYSTNGTTWISTGVLVAGNGGFNATRLDGFPEEAAYRLSNVSSNSVVTPAVSRGLYIGALFSGASELQIESTSDLNSRVWTNHSTVFSNLQGAFVSPIRSLADTATFFRARQPATPQVTTTITSYIPDTNATTAGFGIVADDMPKLYRDGFIAAACPLVYHRDGSNAAAAGECYELAGPAGNVAVIIADIAESSPPGTCNLGRPYFDIGAAAFTNLFKEGTGYGLATCRLVPAPVVGNAKMVCVINSGGYYLELRPYNHRAGVSKLEIQGAGGAWIELARTTYNSFVYSSGPQLVFPLNVRLTSRFGEVVSFPAISSMSDGSRFTANSQFNLFPEQGPAPVWVAPPVYTDGFSTVPGAQWTASTFGGLTVTANYSGNVYQGSQSLRISNFNGFGGVDFLSPFLFSHKTGAYIEFAIRSEAAAVNGLKLQIEGLDSSGALAQSIAVALPTIDSNWRVLRILLEPAITPAQINKFRLMNSTGATLPAMNLDSIAFRW